MRLLQQPQLASKKETRTVGRGFQPLFFIIFTLLMTAGIGARLVYLQIAEGANYRKRAEANRIRMIPKQPERGNIFDRNGKLLATTRYPRSVYLWPMAHTKPSWSVVGPRLSKILNIPVEEMEKKLDDSGFNSSLVRIARDLNDAEITVLKEYANELKDVEIHTEAVRYYPHGQELAHVLGYTREITPQQLKRKKQEGYRPGDMIGQMGVEKAYEKLLRGERGGQQVEVDGKGRPIRVLGEKQAKAGSDIHLTIDLNLQKAAEKALTGRNGVIIALNPNNGAVLAMVSHPTFDPNLFSKRRLSKKDWESIQGENHPLLNRAVASAFPPASTFKIVTVTAGLESGKFSPDTVLQTYGSLTVGRVTFAEWNHAGFGPLGFTKALAMSSDTFFYQIGRGVGGPTLIEWARKYGFGEKTGIEFNTEETKGHIPDQAWKQRTWKIPWTVGDSINMSIGQGALQTTPLQVSVMFCIPANGGYKVKPHLLKDHEEAKNWRESLNMKPSTVKTLREGLRKVIAEGTGKALNVSTIPPTSGKSGTAEAWKNRVKANHAWFGAYAPADKPEIVVLAFAEHSGGGGGSVAAPMVLQVMEEFFQKKSLNKSDKADTEALKLRTHSPRMRRQNESRE
ncbi:penicillin-binding protein 2 [Brasilonema bromeliae]|uniref:Penicillin-binding protein 2 n=1 Tax=Brasilonema bromeliae SPC951 TaxID=385972 RepID=A0ABX1PDJ6_9CYAN|nr:penicillin-binding protein 2 [Brasilonema bromeliae]NMG22431.1 penicillin-binding protein 2 [Brasilonema bromeliae SPC951]